MSAIAALALLVALAGSAAADGLGDASSSLEYSRTGDCEDRRICVYRYSVEQRYFEGKWNVSLSANISVQCDSVGVYNGSEARKFCGNIRDSSANGMLYSAEGTRNQAFSTDFLSGRVCFVQTDGGKVVAVYHGSSDSPTAVTVKRNIAAAFQASFGSGRTSEEGEEEEEVEEEEDVQSRHTSHYRRKYPDASTVVMHRSITEKDVSEYWGAVPRRDTKLTTEEDIEYRSGILQHSTGTSQLELMARHLKKLQREKEEKGEGDASHVVSPGTFSVWSHYSLDVGRCYLLPARARQRRGGREPLVATTLRAPFDRNAAGVRRMEKIKKVVPSASDALSQLHSSKADGETELWSQLHRLVKLESEFGSIPGETPVLDDVLKFLDNVQGSQSSPDSAIRSTIYSLLGHEGSKRSQMALLQCLQESSSMSKEEWNSLVIAVSLVKNANMDFVLGVEKLLDPLPGNSDPLLLSYGALAAEAAPSVEEHIVSVLLRRLALTPRSDTQGIVHLLHALGNAGSSLSLSAVLSYLSSSDEDVQLAAIGALRKLTSSTRVQSAFTGMLIEPTVTREAVLAIAQCLVKGEELFELRGSDDTIEYDRALISALIASAKQSGDPEITKLVVSFLETIEHNDLQDSVTSLSSTRAERGAQWDDPNSDYDVVASYYDRRVDVQIYPCHYAFLWGKEIGVSELNAGAGAGVFSGVSTNCEHFKIFGRAVAKASAFGYERSAVDATLFLEKTDDKVHLKVYIDVAGNVLLDHNEFNFTSSYVHKTASPYFDLKFPLITVSIQIGSIDVDIRFSVKLFTEFGGNMRLGVVDKHLSTGTVSIVPTARYTLSGNACVTVLEAGRIGMTLMGSMSYKIKSEAMASMCGYCPFTCRSNSQTCVRAYDQWGDADIELYAWYQIRDIEYCPGYYISWYPCGFGWGDRERYDPLSKDWSLPGRLSQPLYDTCGDTSLLCPEQPTQPVVTTAAEPEKEELSDKKGEREEEEVISGSSSQHG